MINRKETIPGRTKGERNEKIGNRTMSDILTSKRLEDKHEQEFTTTCAVAPTTMSPVKPQTLHRRRT